MNISRMEPDLCLCVSLSQTICVGPNAISDTLVVLPFSAGLINYILFTMGGMVDAINLETFYSNAFWPKDTSSENSLVMFAGEYKGDNGVVR